MNSETVPSILKSALPQLRSQLAKRLAEKGIRSAAVKRPVNRLPIRVAFSRKKLIARGAGVYEDSVAGDIWYRQGDFLVRQAVDTSSLIEDYLKTCQQH